MGWDMALLGQLIGNSFALLWVIVPAVLFGIIVGALPGFSASNTLIILLPLTLTMELDVALAFMASVYASSHLGGGIPAILVNMPGDGGAAATTLDGYPMTLKGKGQQALVLCFVASTMGGLITSLATVALLPYLAPIGLYLRSVDMVVVMVLGLVLIAAIASDDLLKGLIAGFFGLMLGLIGTDHIYSTPRATFGFLELYDGIPIIAALIGLFAIAETFSILERETIVPKTAVDHTRPRWADTLDGLRLSAKYWWQTVWTAFLGMLMAIGVPGGATSAVMMVVLQYQGIVLGPRLFLDTPELAYGVFFYMTMSYAVMLLTILPLARYMSKVVFMPTRIIVPLIITLTIIGAFANRDYLFDMGLALVFAVLGYIAVKTNYHVIAILIGILLGPLFEQYLLRSLRLGQGDLTILFSSTIGNVLWVMVILSLLLPWLRTRQR